jgi:type IV pilus assembly protein PilP
MIRHSVAISMLMLIVLAACSESGNAPRTPVSPGPKPAPKVASQETATAAQASPQPEYVYSAAGKRDPFSSIIVKEGPGAKLSERPPLERYSLSEFKLAGVMWGGFGYSAMLEGPDGRGYFVHVGTVIGPNNGVVKSITQHTMVVVEKFKTMTGDIDRRETVVELRKKQEGIQ